MSGVLQVAVSCFSEWQRAEAAYRKSVVYKIKSREGAPIWKQKPEVAIAHAAKKTISRGADRAGVDAVERLKMTPLAGRKKASAQRPGQLLQQS